MSATDTQRVFLPNSTGCFICGEDNPAGLKTRFYIEDGVVKADLLPQKHHCGYPNVVHGGIVAGILDECMGWAAARAVQRMCLTAELTTRYLENVPADETATVTTEILKSHRRLVHVRAELIGNKGKIYARAEGKFSPLSAQETLEIDDVLLYRGGEERLFDTLRNG